MSECSHPSVCLVSTITEGSKRPCRAGADGKKTWGSGTKVREERSRGGFWEQTRQKEREKRMRRRRRKHKGERRNGGKIEKRRSVSCFIGAAACENTHSALLSSRCLMRRASREKRMHAHTQRGKRHPRPHAYSRAHARAHRDLQPSLFNNNFCRPVSVPSPSCSL